MSFGVSVSRPRAASMRARSAVEATVTRRPLPIGSCGRNPSRTTEGQHPIVDPRQHRREHPSQHERAPAAAAHPQSRGRRLGGGLPGSCDRSPRATVGLNSGLPVWRWGQSEGASRSARVRVFSRGGGRRRQHIRPSGREVGAHLRAPVTCIGRSETRAAVRRRRRRAARRGRAGRRRRRSPRRARRRPSRTGRHGGASADR